MKCLISREYKISIFIEDNEVVVCSVSLSSGVSTVISRGDSFSFSLIYKKIYSYLNESGNKNCTYFILENDFSKILLHIEQYKNNLYGFYLGENKASPGDVMLLQMSYIEHFISELSSLIFSMSDADLVKFEDRLLNKSSADEFYSEKYYLNDIYKILKK